MPNCDEKKLTGYNGENGEIEKIVAQILKKWNGVSTDELEAALVEFSESIKDISYASLAHVNMSKPNQDANQIKLLEALGLIVAVQIDSLKSLIIKNNVEEVKRVAHSSSVFMQKLFEGLKGESKPIFWLFGDSITITGIFDRIRVAIDSIKHSVRECVIPDVGLAYNNLRRLFFNELTDYFALHANMWSKGTFEKKLCECIQSLAEEAEEFRDLLAFIREFYTEFTTSLFGNKKGVLSFCGIIKSFILNKVPVSQDSELVIEIEALEGKLEQSSNERKTTYGEQRQGKKRSSEQVGISSGEEKDAFKKQQRAVSSITELLGGNSYKIAGDFEKSLLSDEPSGKRVPVLRHR